MNIETLTASQHRSVPLNLDRVLFRGVHRVVTWYAMQRVQAHYKSMKVPLKPCTGTFTRSMGLPCAHIINERKPLDSLHPQDFDPHWFWDYNDRRIPLRELQRVCTSVNTL
jgi:hypothetical protein